MSQSRFIFELVNKEPNIRMHLGFVLQKLFWMTIKSEKVKKKQQQNSCSLECFLGFSIRCWWFTVNLEAWKTKAVLFVRCSVGCLSKSSRVLRTLIQMFQDYVIYSLSKCHFLTHNLLSDWKPTANYPESAYDPELTLAYIDIIVVKLLTKIMKLL